MILTRLSVARPVFTTMVVGVLMVLGVLGLAQLPVDLFPKVSLPVLMVAVPWPGASPEAVEAEVVRPVEEAVVGLPGLDETLSISRENVGVVVLRFSMDADVAEVSDAFRERVQGLAAELPDGVMAPVFSRMDPAATPVMTLAVASDLDPYETARLVEDRLEPALERIDGVGGVKTRGAVEREVHVELDLPALAEQRIPVLRVAQIMGYDTRDIPGGTLEAGGHRFGVRSPGKVHDLDELGSVVLQGFPQPVTLADVAHLSVGEAERSTLARVDGRRAVTVEVVKESGANTVAVCHEVHEVLDTLELPAGVEVRPVLDQSRMVEDMLHEMQRTLLLGALMAVLVVYLFLVDWRSTLISALALPTSVVTTFFFMWLAGFSLNLLSLLAMVLAVGILIDDAVVVREVIYRKQEEGLDARTAALEGTREVALAVLATTSSILAVFVPVGFVGGMVGQFFREFGLTIAIAVAVSLFIAFTVDPALSARISKVTPHDERGRVARGILAFWQWVDDRYRDVLGWSLSHGWVIVAGATALLVGSLGLVALAGSEFIPAYDRDQFVVQVTLPPGLDLEAAEARVAEVEAVLTELPEVEHVYAVVGPDGDLGRADLRVLTSRKVTRDRSVFEVFADARARLERLPGLSVSVRDAPLLEGAQMGAGIEVELRGRDLSALQALALEIRARLRAIPGAADVTTSWQPPRPELQVQVDRQRAAAAGLSVGQAGIALRMAVAGQVVGSLHDGDRPVDIRLRARPEDRTPETLLSSVLLLSPLPRVDDPWGLGTPVALGDVARLGWDDAPTSITRRDRQRVVVVSCGVEGRHLSDVQADVQAVLDDVDRPDDGVDVALRGEVEAASDAMGSLLLALGLAVVFVYAVLASQFESFLHPLTIMLSLPLAMVGALLTLFLMGWPVGILSMLGIILLMGLVTKNAILLVDRANQLRDAGRTVREALLEAGHVRLRPILMTSLAMILGMLPAALSTGPGSEIHQPLAAPVIGGLVGSTLLTLLVVPVVYQGVEGLRQRLSGGTP